MSEQQQDEWQFEILIWDDGSIFVKCGDKKAFLHFSTEGDQEDLKIIVDETVTVKRKES